MNVIVSRIIGLHNDQRGQATVEWTLLIAAFGIPMLWVFREMLAILTGYYRMTGFVLSLPFP
ncbi:MAG: hypothetical protein K8S55_11650 [Phycisphaerae bacterium]|nr:hypothetical protein [Phycisphaerae bacterium]